MRQLIATVFAVFLGFFVLVSSLFFAVGISVVGFFMSKTHKRRADKEARIIEGECSNVTYS